MFANAFVQNGKAVKRRLSFVYFSKCARVFVVAPYSTAFAPLTECFYAHQQLFNLNTVCYQKWAIATYYTHCANSIDVNSYTQKIGLFQIPENPLQCPNTRKQNGQPKRHKHLYLGVRAIHTERGDKGKQKKTTSKEIYKRKMRDTFSRRHHKKWLWLSDRYLCWCRYTHELSS